MKNEERGSASRAVSFDCADEIKQGENTQGLVPPCVPVSIIRLKMEVRFCQGQKTSLANKEYHRTSCR